MIDFKVVVKELGLDGVVVFDVVLVVLISVMDWMVFLIEVVFKDVLIEGLVFKFCKVFSFIWVVVIGMIVSLLLFELLELFGCDCSM